MAQSFVRGQACDYDLQYFSGQVARANAFHVGEHDHSSAAGRSHEESRAGSLLPPGMAEFLESIGAAAPHPKP